MGESIGTQILHTDLEVPCPRCEYPVWVRGAEVVAQTTVLCPCCRTRIQLVDDNGSAQNAGDVIERQITETLKRMFR